MKKYIILSAVLIFLLFFLPWLWGGPARQTVPELAPTPAAEADNPPEQSPEPEPQPDPPEETPGTAKISVFEQELPIRDASATSSSDPRI